MQLYDLSCREYASNKADTNIANVRIHSEELLGGIGSVKIHGLLFEKADESLRYGDRFDGSMTCRQMSFALESSTFVEDVLIMLPLNR